MHLSTPEIIQVSKYLKRYAVKLEELLYPVLHTFHSKPHHIDRELAQTWAHLASVPHRGRTRKT